MFGGQGRGPNHDGCNLLGSGERALHGPGTVYNNGVGDVRLDPAFVTNLSPVPQPETSAWLLAGLAVLALAFVAESAFRLR